MEVGPAPKTLQRLAEKDDRITEVWSEGEDGHWADLKPGLICRLTETHGIHEYTVAEFKDALASVGPCDCRECIADQQGEG